MALTAHQRSICRLLASGRLGRESYVAGGVALNKLLDAPRRSRDIDLFHDTVEALARSLQHDVELLRANAYTCDFLRQAPTFAEARVSRASDLTLIQWVHDSAYRFFPLIEDDELGLTLHPVDLAANKVLAMAGRLEPRDWIDVIHSHRKLQPLGYVAWAACGKDPGYSPMSLLQEMQRSSKYSQAELDLLDFDGAPPSAKELAGEWHRILGEANAICEILPPEEAGMCVVIDDGKLCRLEPDALAGALAAGRLHFHSGYIGGAWPTFPAREP